LEHGPTQRNREIVLSKLITGSELGVSINLQFSAFWAICVVNFLCAMRLSGLWPLMVIFYSPMTVDNEHKENQHSSNTEKKKEKEKNTYTCIMPCKMTKRN